MWHRKAIDKEIVIAMATKFSEIFAISMLKKHKIFCRRGLTHLDATPTFKNRLNTYDSPCIESLDHPISSIAGKLHVYNIKPDSRFYELAPGLVS